MNTNRCFLSAAIGIGLLFIFSLPAWPGTLQGPKEPTNEEILRIIYPDGKLTKDVKNGFVIEGGRYAENNVLGEGVAPKIIERIDRLRGRLYQKDREELVVLVKAINEDAANCCGGEAILAVFDLRGEKAKPIWTHRLNRMGLVGAELSLIEANSYGTQQILFKYKTRRPVQETAIIYIPRPSPGWSAPMPWNNSESNFWIKKDTPDQPFVKIWVGNLKWDEGPTFFYGYETQPTGSDFPRTAYTSKIWFSETINPGDVWEGWKALFEERTITMLLGKTLDPPLKIKMTYQFLNVYFLAEKN